MVEVWFTLMSGDRSPARFNGNRQSRSKENLMEKDPRRPSPSAPSDPLQPVFEVLQGGDPEVVRLKYGIPRADLDRRIRDYQTARRQTALHEALTMEKVGRNDPCPCGSGKKYKKCCMAKHQELRESLPPEQLRRMEEKAKLQKTLKEEAEKGFDRIFNQDFLKARRLAEQMIESYPEDDRFHDILVSSCMAAGEYDRAFHVCRKRWQIAREEKAFYQENGYHQRAGQDDSRPVYFYSPSTWLEKFWIAQRARHYTARFPADEGSPLATKVKKLLAANDMKRFPHKRQEGYAKRRELLEPVLEELEEAGPDAIPHLLPLTYAFSWAALFVPEILASYGSEESARLLAELSMFRFPFFAQNCLTCLEALGDDAVGPIQGVLEDNAPFDELKVGLIRVLGNIGTSRSLEILAGLASHESPYVLSGVVQALEDREEPRAKDALREARGRLESFDTLSSTLRELAAEGRASG